MTNPSPDLIRQVEAESVANDLKFRSLIGDILDATSNMDTSKPFEVAMDQFIAHIDSIITARVAAATQQAYEAGRLAASPAAPAGQLDAGVSMFSDEAAPGQTDAEQTGVSLHNPFAKAPFFPGSMGTQLERDAARYRWLRDSANQEDPYMASVFEGVELDAAIDSAIAALSKEKP